MIGVVWAEAGAATKPLPPAKNTTEANSGEIFTSNLLIRPVQSTRFAEYNRGHDDRRLTPLARISPRSVVAVHALAAFVALLRLQPQCRNRPSLQARQTDRFPRLLTIAVGAFFDPTQGFVNL